MSESLDRKRFLEICYETWLGRPPDPEGLAHHLATLEAEPDDLEFVTEMFRRITGSREYEIVQGQRALREQELADDQSLDVLGIGTHCLTAELLRDMGLRRFALPFDWLFTSPEMLVHVLKDDFAVFLDRSQYRSVTEEERVTPGSNLANHVFYLEEYGVRFVFNHHDPLTDEGYEYLVRCVDRFRGLRNRTTRQVCILLNQDEESRGYHLSAYHELVDLLSAEYCIFVNLEHGGGPTATYEVIEQRPGHEVARYESSSRLRGVKYDDDADYATLGYVLAKRIKARFDGAA